MSLVERLREHAQRVAGGGPSSEDGTYDPETLEIEMDAADAIESRDRKIRHLNDKLEGAAVRMGELEAALTEARWYVAERDYHTELRERIDALISTAPATDRVGIVVRCTTCGAAKKPIGRSAPIGMDMCDDECPGYRQEPRPGSLWAGERESEFGYPVGPDGTAPATEPPK